MTIVNITFHATAGWQMTLSSLVHFTVPAVWKVRSYVVCAVHLSQLRIQASAEQAY